jgi:hypothetical protein
VSLWRRRGKAGEAGCGVHGRDGSGQAGRRQAPTGQAPARAVSVGGGGRAVAPAREEPTAPVSSVGAVVVEWVGKKVRNFFF